MKKVVVTLFVLVLTAATAGLALAQCGGCSSASSFPTYGQGNVGYPSAYLKSQLQGGSCCSAGNSYTGYRSSAQNAPGQLPPCCQSGPGAAPAPSYSRNAPNNSALPPCCQTGPGRAQAPAYPKNAPSNLALPPCCQTGAKQVKAYNVRGPVRAEYAPTSYKRSRRVSVQPAARKSAGLSEAPQLPSCCSGPGRAAALFTKQAVQAKPAKTLWALLNGSNADNRSAAPQQAAPAPQKTITLSSLLSGSNGWVRPASAPASSTPGPIAKNLPPCCAAQ